MSIGNNDPSAVATRNLRHVLAQAAFFQERLPPLEASIRTLIAEVTELRAENLNLRERLEIRIQHGHALRTMLESATETERAAVVAWLRKSANDTMLDPMTDRQVYARTYSALHRHADEIERGGHRNEVKP